MVTILGARCVVIGSAPLKQKIRVNPGELVVAVNGGISSAPGDVDVWVVNSRDISASSWSPAQRRLSTLMLEQGSGKRIPLGVLLIKSDGAAAWTQKYLRPKATRFESIIEIHNEQRRDIELQAGGRTPVMAKHALSAGFFTAAWLLWQNAEHVRLEGFSWEGGYQYLPGEAFPVRGHLAGDKAALRLLMMRYPGRLTHSLTEGPMAKKTTRSAPPRATPATRASSRNARKAARDATLPAAQAKAKTEAKAAENAAPAPRKPKLLVEATDKTYYNLRRYRPGERFTLRDASHYRESCMRWVDPDSAPARPDTGDGKTARPADEVSQTKRPTDDNPLGIE